MNIQAKMDIQAKVKYDFDKTVYTLLKKELKQLITLLQPSKVTVTNLFVKELSKGALVFNWSYNDTKLLYVELEELFASLSVEAFPAILTLKEKLDSVIY